LVLPFGNEVGFLYLRVTQAKIKDADILIGMDIISAGDFVVTNYEGKTVFSFRIPSCECIDFVALARNKISSVQKGDVGRNDPCPCGSGLEYKKCHGK
jgi:hypothetical protein